MPLKQHHVKKIIYTQLKSHLFFGDLYFTTECCYNLINYSYLIIAISFLILITILLSTVKNSLTNY